MTKPDTLPTQLALRPREAAKALNVCEKTLRNWTKAGLITPVKIPGGTVLFPVTELERFLGAEGDQAAD